MAILIFLRFNCLIILMGFLSLYQLHGQDTTPPSIASVVPSDNSTGLSVTTERVTITFSEPVTDPSGSVTITPTIAFTTSFDAGTPNKLAIIFTPTLDYSTTYTITLTGVADKAATPNTANLSTSFTTEQAPAPAIANVSPLNGATGLSVSETDRVDFTFTQPIANPAGKITIDPDIAFTIDFSNSTTLGVIFNPPTLGFSEEYTITLTGIEHEADASSTANLSTSFTTEQGPAPIIKDVVPQDGATGLSVRSTDQVLITFEEGISMPTGGFSVSINPIINFNTDFDSFNPFELPIDLTNTEILSHNTTYTVTLTGIPSAADPTSVSGPLTTSFTTGLAASVVVDTTTNICIGDPEGQELDDIVIRENMKDNFYNTTSSGSTHSFTLQVPNGFEFIDGSGEIELLSSADTDIKSSNLTVLTDKTLVRIDYTLCTLDEGNCPLGFNSEKSDVITIKGLKVKAVLNNLEENTYYAVRRINDVSAARNDAEMPGLGGGTVFARMQVARGPEMVIFNEENQVVADGQIIEFCPEGSAALRFAFADSTAIPSTVNSLTFFVDGIEVSTSDFVIQNNTIIIDSTDANTFIENNTSADYPLTISAEVQLSANACIGSSTFADVNILEPSETEVEITLSEGITNGGQVTPVEGLGISVGVNPLGGNLIVETEVEGIVTSIDNYDNADPYIIDIFSLAKENREVNLKLIYTAVNNLGCIIGSDRFDIIIQKIPKIEEDLGIFPSYCSNETDTILINFTPDNITDSTYINDLIISGSGISGSVSSAYDPRIGEDSTGFIFNVSEAREFAKSQGLSSVQLTMNYSDSSSKPIYESVCRLETEIYFVEECELIYDCVPCAPGDPCYDPFDPCDPRDPRSICYDPCFDSPSGPCLEPFSLRKLEEKKDSLDQLRANDININSAIINNCACGINEKCVIVDEICRQVQKTRTIQVCEDEIVGYEGVKSDIQKDYEVRFIDVPELEFRTVTREPVDTVFCENAGTIFLLGGPGNTFENKSFAIFDGNTTETLDNYSFTVGENGLVPREEPYQLIFNFLGDLENCATRDTLDFRIVPIPDVITFPDELEQIRNIPTYSYCVGSSIDSISFAIEDDIELIWRDERGSILARNNSFSPPVDPFEVGLTRFTVERRHIKGGCSGELMDFYVKVAEIPIANFDYFSNCGSQAIFTTLATHSGSAEENDSITSYFWNFDTTNGDFIETIQSNTTHTYSTPGVYDASFIVQTSIGCTDTITKKVTVFDEADYVMDNGKFSYAEDFTSGSNGWISTADNNNSAATAENSSWNIRELEGQTAWHTYIEEEGTYSDNEFSWVQSPYINLSNWNSPKLQMDVLFDTPDLEGAVLQYQVKDCNTTDGTETWVTVGTRDNGLDWYNNSSISAGPGGSIIGWSGISANGGSWQTVAYDLAGIRAAAGNNLVQFRIAFASLSLGANREQGRKGFAFTNFTISEKERKSLVEHFTHTDEPLAEREFVSRFANSREDVIYIQYHMGRPAGDPLYYGYHFAENTSVDSDVRSFVYGFLTPSYTVVNGRFQSFDPFTAGWGERQYSRETLLAPAFDLSLDYSYQEGQPLKVTARAIRNNNIVPLIDTAQQPQLMSLKVAVVEKEVTGYTADTLKNVFVKYLGQHPGAFEIKGWKAGSGDSLLLEEEWQIPVDAVPGRFGLVAWIELARDSPEKGPKGLPFNNIFQATEIVINTDLVAAEVLNNRKTLAGNWVVYPVPAADFLQVQRQENIQSAIEWQVVNALGSIVKRGKYSGGNNGFEVELTGLNSGIYMIQLNSREGQLQKKFVKQ